MILVCGSQTLNFANVILNFLFVYVWRLMVKKLKICIQCKSYWDEQGGWGGWLGVRSWNLDHSFWISKIIRRNLDNRAIQVLNLRKISLTLKKLSKFTHIPHLSIPSESLTVFLLFLLLLTVTYILMLKLFLFLLFCFKKIFLFNLNKLLSYGVVASVFV